ncbi:MAG: cobalamin biosynthesis protein [Nitratireductor sp.]|nr:cobalamin biosynthesis protein [Nitratireductor sp.]
MSGLHLWLLLAALVIDWVLGEPDWLWGRVPHPVVWFGRLIGWLDATLNLDTDSDELRYRKGAVAWAVMIAIAVLTSFVLDWLFKLLGPAGMVAEIFVVFVLVAQKSLKDHVFAVAHGLQREGLVGGRRAVSMIVGRDPERLDRSGVSRAAIESLAENFSDGIVAPVFWYAVFGLPGIVVYKMINTADSMIAHKSARHLWFGRVAAIADDLANWIPARLSALLIAAGTLAVSGGARAGLALKTALRDAGIHRSPNAGWPEAAMAGALGLALGGPRSYPGETVQESHINATGRLDADARDISRALDVYRAACIAMWIAILLAAVSSL